MGTHEKAITRKADAAISTRNMLVKEGSDDAHIAIIAAASDEPKGVLNDTPSAAEDNVSVELLNARAETVTMVGNAAIDEGADVYSAGDGKVGVEPTSAGTYWKVGKALADCSGDGVEFEVEPIQPQKVVVIAALTSTDGTAAAASADLAALAAEAEKIGDDVRAIGAALATPALVKVLT